MGTIGYDDFYTLILPFPVTLPSYTNLPYLPYFVLPQSVYLPKAVDSYTIMR